MSRKTVGKKRDNEAQQKRRKYVKNRTIKGLNKKDAALEAGFPLSMAENAAAKIETPEVIAAIEEFDRALVMVIPTARLVQKLNEGLDATVVKTAQFKGEITDEKEYVDYPTRLQYVREVALMSKRFTPNSKLELSAADAVVARLLAGRKRAQQEANAQG